MSTKKLTKKDLLDLAKGLDLKGISKLKKDELIHSIQIAEGHAPCFLTIENCAVSPCLFRADCQND
ncbi:MAG: hypothetical protein CO186_08390 [Zetaproteobacteria bacterium CG_4_9_14_3_um_filter_49_83]|nr:MAG: hypothetical protein AUJ56_13405 [Zetaproteobacteria bacterium CG1_02_49_23]PIQ31351.1 MAG: hypothetical protein COW62_10135 [Zetaproteobacteria bacterium CG17_big_fil_post_rev_8_21_14_2_50_50_13]PIV31263.1 MAG: hypothetical protein COS35_02315 [Zetaproteobacteria bacterium CG02_land_8_20_14_3_00_50_9]PIY55381.1 MAG: hypothetical protein COZ00_09890 [Zetaproteobacteria bacterium CG_4_10_14_0_8_um_filter_49_80]PJA34927.1 MAG: hypothetical protein CO186_08390 [Zetaproteobacteria bacterium